VFLIVRMSLKRAGIMAAVYAAAVCAAVRIRRKKKKEKRKKKRKKKKKKKEEERKKHGGGREGKKGGEKRGGNAECGPARHTTHCVQARARARLVFAAGNKRSYCRTLIAEAIVITQIAGLSSSRVSHRQPRRAISPANSPGI